MIRRILDIASETQLNNLVHNVANLAMDIFDMFSKIVSGTIINGQYFTDVIFNLTYDGDAFTVVPLVLYDGGNFDGLITIDGGSFI